VSSCATNHGSASSDCPMVEPVAPKVTNRGAAAPSRGARLHSGVAGYQLVEKAKQAADKSAQPPTPTPMPLTHTGSFAPHRVPRPASSAGRVHERCARSRRATALPTHRRDAPVPSSNSAAAGVDRPHAGSKTDTPMPRFDEATDGHLSHFDRVRMSARSPTDEQLTSDAKMRSYRSVNGSRRAPRQRDTRTRSPRCHRRFARPDAIAARTG
jgi:hypothetical protein